MDNRVIPADKVAEEIFSSVERASREAAGKMADVMSAYANGATIQCKLKGCDDDWGVVTDPAWLWDSVEYRVKPERIRVYGVRETRGSMIVNFHDKDAAINYYHGINRFHWHGWLVAEQGE